MHMRRGSATKPDVGATGDRRGPGAPAGSGATSVSVLPLLEVVGPVVGKGDGEVGEGERAGVAV